MLQLRRPQSAAAAVSVTNSLVVVLLAAMVHGATSLRCWRTSYDPKIPKAVRAQECNPGDLCLYTYKFDFPVPIFPEVRHCAPPKMCAEEMAKRKGTYFAECCDTDLCNDETLVMKQRTKNTTRTTPRTTSLTTANSTATTAVHANTTVQQNLTTTEATNQSTTNTTQTLPASNTSAVQSTTTSQQSTTTTDHTSLASQSTPGNLNSTSTRASNTSSETSPSTSSTDATGAVKVTGSTQSDAPGPSMFYAWIALMGVGVVGAVISAVLFVLTFRGIICAPKPSPGSDVVTKELDKTLV